MDKAIKEGIKFRLTNNRAQIFRSRVSGEWRPEITQPHSWYLQRNYPDIIHEKIRYRDRYFIPVGSKGIETLEKLLKDNPVRNTAQEELTQYQSREYLKDEKKPRQKATYNETETRFMIWAHGSAPVGEVKGFYRFKKIRFYEKTEDYCVELSRAQYEERVGRNGEKTYARIQRQVNEAADFDESSEGTLLGYLDSHRNGRTAASISGQAFGEELRDDA